ncbi:hypothetical protein EV177_005036 [Coemansia sp. RSA 1804]|nr:hypothetical protein EV177_005036 [Coemansia sp. RSA 1804]
MFSWFRHRVAASARSQGVLLLQRSKHTANTTMGHVRQRNAIKNLSNRPEVTIFTRNGPSNPFKWGPWVAGGQLLLWINFADFYWNYSLAKDEETGEMKPLEMWKRASLSSVALVAGLAIGGGLLHFISRSVARVQILNGKTVQLDVFRVTGRGTVSRKYPLHLMYSKDILYTGVGPAGLTKPSSTQYSIQAPGNKYAFILSRSGEFPDPKIFDLLFHRTSV